MQKFRNSFRVLPFPFLAPPPTRPPAEEMLVSEVILA